MNRTSRNTIAVLAGLLLSAAALTAHAHCANTNHNIKKHGGPNECGDTERTFDVSLTDKINGAISGSNDGTLNGLRIDGDVPLTGVLVGIQSVSILDENGAPVEDENGDPVSLADEYNNRCSNKDKDAIAPDPAFATVWFAGVNREMDEASVLFQGIEGDPNNPEDVYSVLMRGFYHRDCAFPFDGVDLPDETDCPISPELTDWQIMDRRKGKNKCRIVSDGISVEFSIFETTP